MSPVLFTGPRICVLLLLLRSIILQDSFAAEPNSNLEDRRPPNILLIVADDLGFNDLGAYGSEISTPNLDSLAREGLQLTNFHAGQTCSISRAMLLSGTDSHLAGLGSMTETMHASRDRRLEKAGYEGFLNSSVASLGEVLQDAGYRTYVTGKWHLGSDGQTDPPARGFDKSWVLLDGGAGHLSDQALIGPPGRARYRENGAPATPPDDFYSSQFYAQKMIEFMRADQDESRPFFAYLAFTAPHWPLQAPGKSVERFRGRYDDGYEALHNERVDRMQTLGLIDSDVEPAALPRKASTWERLSDAERSAESRKMEIYAAMVSDMDIYIGQVMDYLRSTGELDSTVIVFLSDNGPEGSLFEPTSWPILAQWVAACCDNSIDNMGRASSYLWTGPGWAWVSAAPYRGTKGAAFEGGLRVPAIVSYPDLPAAGRRSDAFLTIMDVMPTLLEAAGLDRPGVQFRDRNVLPMRGRSMLPLLLGKSQTVHEPTESFGWELWGQAAIRNGNWKLVKSPEIGQPAWQLFDLGADPTEETNVSTEHPEMFKLLESLWREYSREVGLLDVDWWDE